VITTAHRRQRPAAHQLARPASLAGVLIAAAATLLLAACSPVSVSDAPASGTASSPINTGSDGADATAADGEDANADGSDGSDGSASGSGEGCQVTINGPGSIRVNGASNRVVTRNGASSLSCANGPQMAIGEVENGAVTFSVDGGQPVRIATGQSATVADYEVTVNEADGTRAEFVVTS
jgi:hypothetical protein